MTPARAPGHPNETGLLTAEELERIPGVLAASVWMGDASQVREIFIAAAPDASVPVLQQAAGEVLRRTGLSFAPGAIQIGQVDETAAALEPQGEPDVPRSPEGASVALATLPALWSGRFLILGGVEVYRSGNQATVRVQLVRLGETFYAECRELDTETGRARAAARAALSAAEQAGSSARLGLEGVLLADLFGRRYVVVSVEAANARRFRQLSGILDVDPARSIEETACLATLRAVERWVAW